MRTPSVFAAAGVALLISVSTTVAQTPAPSVCAPDTVNKKPDPFAFADFTWLNGNPRTKDSPISTEYFTGEFRADMNFLRDFNNPQDHTLVGTTEGGRTSELQVQMLGLGGDFHCGNMKARFMTQLGMYSTMTPRNEIGRASCRERV